MEMELPEEVIRAVQHREATRELDRDLAQMDPLERQVVLRQLARELDQAVAKHLGAIPYPTT